MERVVGVVLHFFQARQPFAQGFFGFDAARLDLYGALFGVLVPDGDDARLSKRVHVARADLYVKDDAAGHEDAGVQRAVAVALGGGDVVFEFAVDGSVEAVQAAKDAVAVVFVVGEDADGDGADGFFEAFFALHALIDAPEVALAFVDGGLDVERLQARL